MRSHYRDRLMVEIENLRERLAAHSMVEQQHCIGPPCQGRLCLPLPNNRGKGFSEARSRNPPPIMSRPEWQGEPSPWQAVLSLASGIRVYLI